MLAGGMGLIYLGLRIETPMSRHLLPAAIADLIWRWIARLGDRVEASLFPQVYCDYTLVDDARRFILVFLVRHILSGVYPARARQLWLFILFVVRLPSR